MLLCIFAEEEKGAQDGYFIKYSITSVSLLSKKEYMVITDAANYYHEFYTVSKAIWYKLYPLCLEYVIVFNKWNVGEALRLRTGHIKEFKCSTPIYIF